jgi:hypothetical protein
MTVTDPGIGQESFANSPVVIRSNINAEVAGRVAGQALVDSKLQPRTVNWNLDMYDTGTI